MIKNPEMWLNLKERTGIRCRPCEEAKRKGSDGNPVVLYKTNTDVLICPHCDWRV